MTTPHEPILELKNISASYDAISVLHDVNITVQRGEVVALLGPNGAGKSTVLKVASALMRPTRGSISIAGLDLTGAAASELARLGVCTIPEGRGVFPNLTVHENLQMAVRKGLPISVVQDRAFARFPILAERRTQLAGTLSGGQQQMLSLARGLATEPVLLMLDEMSMGLAPLVVADLYEQVKVIAAEGVSVLVVEQFARTVLGIADTAVVMSHGRVRFAGNAREVDEATLSSAYLGTKEADE
ncbi:MAG: ABC transporter ATP-binding protein [Ilumatobacteraceae bacterium]|nr:ABC transporter ATP-binding protein [Ilumatobacteraceae bacterium]